MRLEVGGDVVDARGTTASDQRARRGSAPARVGPAASQHRPDHLVVGRTTETRGIYAVIEPTD